MKFLRTRTARSLCLLAGSCVIPRSGSLHHLEGIFVIVPNLLPLFVFCLGDLLAVEPLAHPASFIEHAGHPFHIPDRLDVQTTESSLVQPWLQVEGILALQQSVAELRGVQELRRRSDTRCELRRLWLCSRRSRVWVCGSARSCGMHFLSQRTSWRLCAVSSAASILVGVDEVREQLNMSQAYA